MTGFAITTAQGLKERTEQGPIQHFWCVLTDEYFTGELIPGSRRVPVDRVAREARDLAIASDAEIVVYCSGPDCPQSTAAAEKLASMGFSNVTDFEDGLSVWKEAGYTVNEVAAAASGD